MLMYFAVSSNPLNGRNPRKLFALLPMVSRPELIQATVGGGLSAAPSAPLIAFDGFQSCE